MLSRAHASLGRPTTQAPRSLAALAIVSADSLEKRATSRIEQIVGSDDGVGGNDVIGGNDPNNIIAPRTGGGRATKSCRWLDTSANFTLHTITTTAAGAISVTTADLDGDGDLDVLSASLQDDTIAWYENIPAEIGP